MPVTFSNVGLAEPSTVTARVGTVTIARGSTNELQEILVIGDPQSSLGLAQVLSSSPPSTTPGLVTRLAGAGSATEFISVRITDGSAFAAPSTTVTIRQSTATDLLTAAYVYTSSGGAVAGSTTSPSSGVLGVHVRPVAAPRRSIYSTVVSTASTAFYTVVSSVAAKIVARGYSITSTAVTPMIVTFHTSTNNTPLWHTAVGSGSSGVTGANIAVPDGLFETVSGEPLTLRMTSTGVQIELSMGWFPEA